MLEIWNYLKFWICRLIVYTPKYFLSPYYFWIFSISKKIPLQFSKWRNLLYFSHIKLTLGVSMVGVWHSDQFILLQGLDTPLWRMKKHIRCASYRLFLLNIDFHVFFAVFSMNFGYFEISEKAKIINYIEQSYIMLLSVKSHYQFLSLGFNRLLKSDVKSKKKSIFHVFFFLFFAKNP